MLKFNNPYFKPAAQLEKENKAAKNAPLINGWLLTQNDRRILTLDDVKAALPAIAAELDRETVNMIFELLHLSMLNPDDKTP